MQYLCSTNQCRRSLIPFVNVKPMRFKCENIHKKTACWNGKNNNAVCRFEKDIGFASKQPFLPHFLSNKRKRIICIATDDFMWISERFHKTRKPHIRFIEFRPTSLLYPKLNMSILAGFYVRCGRSLSYTYSCSHSLENVSLAFLSVWRIANSLNISNGIIQMDLEHSSVEEKNGKFKCVNARMELTCCQHGDWY